LTTTIFVATITVRLLGANRMGVGGADSRLCGNEGRRPRGRGRARRAFDPSIHYSPIGAGAQLPKSCTCRRIDRPRYIEIRPALSTA
jgi:hypothetical protein